MSVYRRKTSEGKAGLWWVDVRWRGVPRIQTSTGTRVKAEAQAMLSMLRTLRTTGRSDVLGLLARGDLSLTEVYDSFVRDPALLTHAVARAVAPTLGALGDEWLLWIENPGALSPRTKRPYSPRATERYRVSLHSIFATLPNGRDTRTTDLTRGGLLAYRDQRRKKVTGSSINRDLSALQALRRWAADHKGVRFADFNFPKERENEARYRWMSREEKDEWLPFVPLAWQPFFALLLNTGIRVGEALGLAWGDIHLSDSRISIGAAGRVKTAASVRDVPIGATLAGLLVQHAKTVPSHSTAPVFPQPAFRYAAARAVFKAACKAAKIEGMRIHDLRHTYAVHAIKARVPISRLQRLLGHASPIMTLRYATHAPEAYFAEDAALVDAALNGKPIAAPAGPTTQTTPVLKRA